MRSIEKMTGKEQLAASTPFFAQSGENIKDFSDELSFDLSDDQRKEINDLVQDYCGMTAIRLLQFIGQAKSDKQIISRYIILRKLFENKHGNWKDFQIGHHVTIKTVRNERDKIYEETGLYVQ